MTDEKRDSVLAAIMRKIGELATSIDRNTAALERFAKAEKAAIQDKVPEQPPLPGMPADDWTPPKIEVKPREWSNTVKVWEELFYKFGSNMIPSNLVSVYADGEFLEAISKRTNGKVNPTSLSKIISVLTRAGAAKKEGRIYRIQAPTDELREAVEQMAKKRAAAKEVSA